MLLFPYGGVEQYSVLKWLLFLIYMGSGCQFANFLFFLLYPVTRSAEMAQAANLSCSLVCLCAAKRVQMLRSPF